MTDQPGNISSPRAKIVIDVASVQNARSVVIAAAADMNRAFNSTNPTLHSVANNLRIAQQAARDFANTDLGVIQKSIQDAARSFLGLSAAGAAATVTGIAAAQSMRQLQIAYTAILGSADRARDVLGEIRDLSGEFKLPFLEAATGARGLLQIVNTTGLSMRELMLTSQRLTLLNPQEGAAGASFSLREFLSGGDYVSLSERFNLSRQDLQAIRDQANGNQAAMLRGLDELLTRNGYTVDALREMGESGANAFARVQSSITEAMSTAFEPLLVDVVLPLAEGFASFVDQLRTANPQLLQIGSIFAVAAAGVTPLLVVLNQAITAYRTLATVSALRTFGVGVGALGVGIAGGIGIAQALADRGIGDQRLRSDSGEDPGAVLNERLRQVVVILFAAAGQIAIGLQQGKFLIDNAISLLGAALNLLSLKIQDAALSIVQGLGELLRGVGEQFNISQLKDFGDQIIETTTQMREGRETIVPAYDPVTGSPVTRVGRVDGIQDRIEQAELRLSQGLNLTADQLLALQESYNRINSNNVALAGILDLTGNDIEAAATDSSEQLRQGGQTLFDTLLAAAKSPGWRELTDAIAENAEKIKQANDERLIGVGREAEDYARGRMRTLEDERKANERMERDQLERERQQIAAIEAIQTEAAKREADLLKEDLKERERDLEQHNKRLLDIQRAGHFAIIDAIADGDGVAAIRAVRNAQEQTRKENEDYAARQKQREQDLKDQRDALAEQRDERLRDAVQQLNDMRMEFAEQRAEREADFMQRLAREDEDRTIRLQREQEDFDRRRALETTENERRIANMQAHYFVESGLLQGFQTTVSDIFRRIRDDGIRYFSELGAALGGGGMDGTGMIGGGGGAAALPFAAVGARLLSDGLVFAHAGEVILNQPQQHELSRRSMNVNSSVVINVTNNAEASSWNDEDFISYVSDRVSDNVAEAIRQLADE